MSKKRRVLQLANWDLKLIQSQLPKIKESGFTTIQTSPLQPCKKIWDDAGRIKKHSPEWYAQITKEFWKNYQVYGMTIGNHLGTWEEFIELCEEAHKYDLEISVDVVMRHLSQDDMGRCVPHPDCDQGIASRPDFFMNDNRKADNFADREGMVRGNLGGLPTLNYENPELQEKFYLPFLQSILKYGDSIRIDMCHHIGLPSEGYTFFANVIENLPKDKYITGECNNANDKQLEEYSKYLVPICHVSQWWGHKNAQYYFENHDTVLSFMMNLYMTPEVRLDNYEGCLKRGGDTLFFARQNDPAIFSERMAELNNQYK